MKVVVIGVEVGLVGGEIKKGVMRSRRDLREEGKRPRRARV